MGSLDIVDCEGREKHSTIDDSCGEHNGHKAPHRVLIRAADELICPNHVRHVVLQGERHPYLSQDLTQSARLEQQGFSGSVCSLPLSPCCWVVKYRQEAVSM